MSGVPEERFVLISVSYVHKTFLRNVRTIRAPVLQTKCPPGTSVNGHGSHDRIRRSPDSNRDKLLQETYSPASLYRCEKQIGNLDIHALPLHDQIAENSLLDLFITALFFCIITGTGDQLDQCHFDFCHPAFPCLPGKQWI